MARTVWGAFNSFRQNTVDLDPEVSDKARSSRNYLYDQLKARDKDDPGFPKLADYYIPFIPFGSFARKTKIRPLDDIDILMLLDGTGTSARQSSNALGISNPYDYWLKIDKTDAPLARYPDGVGYVNSTKVLNSIKSSLASVPNYGKADITKNGSAVVLNLTSYPWAFDIVPAVEVVDAWTRQTSYYLIPNGSGDWIRTNPAKDQDYITRVNKQHDGELLPVMRLLKYWNRRTHKPRLQPYYFETLALKVFDYAPKITSYPNALKYFFDHCPFYLMASCADPKGLGPNLDANVDAETKNKVQAALNEAATHAGYALMYEQLKDDKNAIYWWGRVFGPEFPTYE